MDAAESAPSQRLTIRRWAIPSVLLGAAILAAVVGVSLQYFKSPSEVAASASPPKPSLLTTSVVYGPLDAGILFRADVGDASPVQIGVPDSLGNWLPIVTSLNVGPGATVAEGDVVMSIAGRPVIAMLGTIPAYRDMSPGDDGIDIQELQLSLRRLGYSTGADRLGTYGYGTEEAVRRMYHHDGFDVVTSPPDADAQLARLAGNVDAAQAALTAQQATAASIGASNKDSEAAKSAVASAITTLADAQAALSAGEASMGASVPRGEAVFVPSLPQKVVSLSVGLGGLAPAGSQPLGDIGSGKVVLNGAVDSTDASSVRVGQMARVTSDLTGASFDARVVSVSKQGSTSSDSGSSSSVAYPVYLEPAGPISSDFLGQNVQVKVETAASQGDTDIVPAAAVTTTANGTSFVTVVGRNGKTQDVRVRPGLTANGKEGVTPIDGVLVKGQQVVIGVDASAS